MRLHLLIPLLLCAGCSGSDAKIATEPTASPVTETTAPDPPPASAPLELEDLPAPDGASDTYSIRQVMHFAHENRLFRRVMNDPPNLAAAERLLVLYEALPKQTPPQGEADSWQRRTTALVSATKAVIDGANDGAAAFRKAVNCQGCHSHHKP